MNKALCRYYEQKAPEPLTIPRPQDCAHGVLNISNPVGDDAINNGDDSNVLKYRLKNSDLLFYYRYASTRGEATATATRSETTATLVVARLAHHCES